MLLLLLYSVCFYFGRLFSTPNDCIIEFIFLILSYLSLFLLFIKMSKGIILYLTFLSVYHILCYIFPQHEIYTLPLPRGGIEIPIAYHISLFLIVGLIVMFYSKLREVDLLKYFGKSVIIFIIGCVIYFSLRTFVDLSAFISYMVFLMFTVPLVYYLYRILRH